jgi:hypothetical protein
VVINTMLTLYSYTIDEDTSGWRAPLRARSSDAGMFFVMVIAKGVFRSKNFWGKVPIALFVIIW